jgi:asparagine synthase (glutamine-hydrolysing)
VFKYVAFVWNDADAQARDGARVLGDKLRSASAGWAPVLETRGLVVFCRDVRPGTSEPYRLHDDAGVVLGKLFARGSDAVSSTAPNALAEDESAAIVRSGGRRLVDRYWGRYVAFLRDGVCDRTWVLRDPTSGLPCFETRLLGVDVYFSNMEEGALLGERAFSINWKYVAAALCQNRLHVHATGLEQVSQLLGGECITTHQGQSARQFYWNALAIAATDPIEDAREATQLLRIRTRDCVQAWAAGHRSIVHLLSGGLDSSIVLACLRDSLTPDPLTPFRPRLTCLNFHSPGSNTDEREQARLAATVTECEVVERPRNSLLSLEPLLQLRPTCTPENNFFHLDGGRVEAELAVEKQARVIFSGWGGDQLFYQGRASFGAADYLQRHGVGPALFGVALDAARIDRKSVWGVLREALSRGFLRRRWSPRDDVGEYRPLLRSEVIDDIKRDSSFIHPWLVAPGRAPSGKIWHAYQLLFPYDFYNPLGSDTDPEPVTPLFSQPLLELALRIPTWLLTLGGWDRALARRAFQHDVPRPIVTRRTKGGQEEHAKSILVRNLTFARELLLSGKLAGAGILDKRLLAEVLSGRPTRVPTSNVELYACLSVEAWVRKWLPA